MAGKIKVFLIFGDHLLRVLSLVFIVICKQQDPAPEKVQPKKGIF